MKNNQNQKDDEFIMRLRNLKAKYDSGSDFARRCGFCEGTLRAYLAGSSPTVQRLKSIADVSGVTVDWLVTGNGIKYAKDLKRAHKLLLAVEVAEK